MSEERTCQTCWNRISGFNVSDLHNKAEIEEFKYCEMDPARPLTETDCPEWKNEEETLAVLNWAILRVMRR